MNPKEYGSYYGLEENLEWLIPYNSKNDFFNDEYSFSVTGRTALYQIIKYGIEHRDWKEVYVPQYYCHEVIEFVESLEVHISYYHFNPFETTKEIEIPNQKGVAILVVDFFGLKKLEVSFHNNVDIIEDLTFNIRAVSETNSPFVFASLRKELPVISGGFVKSPLLSKNIFSRSNLSEAIDKIRWKAMSLKSDFINDKAASKEKFRSLYAKSESAYANLDLLNAAPSAASIKVLNKLNIHKILEQKDINIDLALSIIGNMEFLVNSEQNILGAGLLFYFNNNSQREKVKAGLIESNIFPAVLWPDQRHEMSKKIASKMLFVHLDYRLNKKDITYICSKLKIVCNGV